MSFWDSLWIKSATSLAAALFQLQDCECGASTLVWAGHSCPTPFAVDRSTRFLTNQKRRTKIPPWPPPEVLSLRRENYF